MKVLLCNNNFQNLCLFQGSREDKRKADIIMRKSKGVFPMLSASYADDFYFSIQEGSKKQSEAGENVQKLWDKIFALRRECDKVERYSKFVMFPSKTVYDLSRISKNRVGNCNECSKAALALLCANGYHNSLRVNLFYRVNFVNKETGKMEYSAASNLDHSFVITDMNTRERQDIVIDPWLGFADYKQGAYSRYKQLYLDDLENYKNMHKKLFIIEKLKEGEEINLEDYEMRTGFLLRETGYSTLEDREKLGELVAGAYPESVLNIEA